MDKLYEVYNNYASSKICLMDYFNEYSELLKSSKYYKSYESIDEKIYQLMDVELSQNRYVLMTHYCSINHLGLPMEDGKGCRSKNAKISEKVINNSGLETLEVLRTCDTSFIKKYKVRNGVTIKYEKTHNKAETLTPVQDFLLYLRVYEPFDYSLHRAIRHHKQNMQVLRLKSVISILGCQTLSELREKIMCISDLSIPKEVSNNPYKAVGQMAKDIYKSGFFFIEDTFYNDMRDPKNIDYSTVILMWANSRNIGPFKTAKMEDTRINSLSARFGYPWVYQHQGCCEHLIVLTDARLVTENDDLVISTYPRIEKIKPSLGKNCYMCGIFSACWITTDHDRIPHMTNYLCNKCFKSYNYVDGKKIGNFKAYRYPSILDLAPKQSKKN